MLTEGLGLKWSKYIPHEPYGKQLAFLMLPHKEALFGGAAGGGKVLYDDAEILTPFGFKKGADLKLGDRVNNPDGSVSRISFLHPRRKFKVWRVTFHDGSTTDVAEEHLWLAWRSGKRSKKSGQQLFGEKSAEVISTRELRDWLLSARKQEACGLRPNWPCIPVAKPQVFNVTRRSFSTIDSYLLGVWLGDGHAGKSRSYYAGITSKDKDSLESLMSGHRHSVSKKNGTDACTYLFRGKSLVWFCEELKKLKLLGKHAWDKFIPDEFKLGSLEKRIAVLQGLLDTDGFVDSRGQVYYTTTSGQLSKDVRFLIQSLGGTATETEKVGNYLSPSGDRIPCRRAYTLYIKLPSTIVPFRFNRKKDRLTYDDSLYRRVTSVEELSFKREGRCITVSHPNGLYLTNDFIVTHNSDALLMAALQYVDVPGYRALIFRKTLADLKQPNALLDRAHAWLEGTDATYVPSEHKYVFPTYDENGNSSEPATLSFGYIGNAQQFLRYQGIEVQFVAFDEVTQHQEEHYRYLFSRLRKCACPIHRVDTRGKPLYDPECRTCQRLKGLPLRVRAATNPGGPGGAWVKRRFRIEPDISSKEAAERGIKQTYIGKSKKRPFIPSFARDNPFLDQESYDESLEELDPTTRQQLKEGRWDVTEDAQFKRNWARYYSRRGEYIILGPEGKGVAHHVTTLQRIFVTVDPATSSRHGPGDTDIWRKQKSYTVISVWGLTEDYNLIWLDMVRFRRQAPEVIKALLRVNAIWKPHYFVIESNGPGQGIYQAASNEGLTVKPVHTRHDKITNATEAMIRMEQGKIWFPESASWLQLAEDEIFFWTGDPITTDDIVDTLSNAARDVTWEDGQVFKNGLDGTSVMLHEAPGYVPIRGFGSSFEYDNWNW